MESAWVFSMGLLPRMSNISGGGGWYEYLELHNGSYPLNLKLKFADG